MYLEDQHPHSTIKKYILKNKMKLAIVHNTLNCIIVYAYQPVFLIRAGVVVVEYNFCFICAYESVTKSNRFLFVFFFFCISFIFMYIIILVCPRMPYSCWKTIWSTMKWKRFMRYWKNHDGSTYHVWCVESNEKEKKKRTVIYHHTRLYLYLQ